MNDQPDAQSLTPADEEAAARADALESARESDTDNEAAASPEASAVQADSDRPDETPDSDDKDRKGSRPRRRRRGRRKPRKRTAPEGGENGAAESDSAVLKPISPTAQVTADDDAVVIRFPPVGSPAGVSDAPAEAEGSDAAPEDVRRDAPDAPEPVVEGDAEETGRKRRGRRRRRSSKSRGAAAGRGKSDAETGDEPRTEPTPDDGAGEPDAQEARPPEPERGEGRKGRRSRRRPRSERAPSQPKTEVETLARKEMIINVVPREECRIAILQEGKLEEIYLERASAENHVGNIYKGVVTNVEASIQAAFVDFGLGKNGFLHISDLHPEYFPDGEGKTENVGRKLPRRSRPPIQRCLRRGQEVIVQITKEGIGTKGPTLTTYPSIPGRFMVLMPSMRRLGVSRKIEDDELRQKLRDQLGELNLPDDMGFIARTAAEGRTKRELQSDLNYLSRLWKAVEKRRKNEKAPAELYRESDLVIRTIRDVFAPDIERIIVDDPEVTARAREFLAIFSPRSRDIIVEYDAPEPIFHKYGIEAELERLHSRHVPLKSGGSLVIDQTEALVAVDVNSGRFRAEDDAETTAYKINMEAADEIPRQLRLRDLGGVVICDFIDMRMESHRREIERRLNRNLKEHKERAKILRMSAFGMIEMTRQRQRASLTRSVYQDCQHCRGTGLVKTAESVALDVMRLVQLAVTREHIRSIELNVSTTVSELLQNRKRALLHKLESENRRTILIRPDSAFGLDQVQLQCYDQRGRLVPHT